MLKSDDLPIEPLPPPESSKLTATLSKMQQAVHDIFVLVVEVAVVAFIGSSIGSYLSAKTIVADCQRVNLAKVGDVYVQCTIVEPKKDLPTSAPR